MPTTLKTLTKDIGLLTIALTLALMANFAYSAWSNPTQAPTGGNTEAPINVSSVSQVKTGGLSTGALSVVGNQGITGEIRITATQPTIKYFDSNGMDFWTRLNNNTFNIFADRNDDGAWSGDGVPALALTSGAATDGSGDYAVFSNQVRANQYCDRTGNNCSTPGGSFTETDPQVGTLTANQWCRANGSGAAVICDQAVPELETTSSQLFAGNVNSSPQSISVDPDQHYKLFGTLNFDAGGCALQLNIGGSWTTVVPGNGSGTDGSFIVDVLLSNNRTYVLGSTDTPSAIVNVSASGQWNGQFRSLNSGAGCDVSTLTILEV